MGKRSEGEYNTKLERRKLKDGTINIMERLTHYNLEKHYTEHLASRLIGKIPPGETEMIPLEHVKEWDWEALGLKRPELGVPAPEKPAPASAAARASAPESAVSPVPVPDTHRPRDPDALVDLGQLTFGWAEELQSLAQAGLAYSRDPYDRERFTRIREIAAEMVARQALLPTQEVRSFFCADAGYQTPKLDTRAAIFRDSRVLLVQENSGGWCLPGGWVDVNCSIRENTVKEVLEEAGLQVSADFLIAIHNQDRHNTPVHIHRICKVFVRCTLLRGGFIPNPETTGSGFFSLDSLPPLDTRKTTREQLELCFQANKAEHWTPVFD